MNTSKTYMKFLNNILISFHRWNDIKLEERQKELILEDNFECELIGVVEELLAEDCFQIYTLTEGDIFILNLN